MSVLLSNFFGMKNFNENINHKKLNSKTIQNDLQFKQIWLTDNSLSTDYFQIKSY